MKKNYIVPLFILSLIISGCSKTSEATLEFIKVKDPVTEYTVGDDFIIPSVIATYSDNTTKDVKDEAKFIGYDTTKAGEYTVLVGYRDKEDSYQIRVSENSDIPTIVSIEAIDPVTSYIVGDEFVKPTIIATYSDSSSKDVSNETKFSGYDMSKAATYTVVATYQDKFVYFDIVVSVRPVEAEVVDIDVRDIVSEYVVGDAFVNPKVFAIYDNETEEDVTSKATFIGYNMTIAETYTVEVSYLTFIKTFDITVKNKEAQYIVVKEDLSLATLIGKDTNLNGKSKVFNEITFTFNKNSGSSTPVSSKDSGGYIALYQNNSLIIAKKTLTKVSFDFVGGYNKNITCDVGEVTQTSTSFSWEGEAESLTLTASGQVRFNSIHVEYKKIDRPDPVLDGFKTIKEIREAASQIDYTLNNSGWYLSNVEVKMQVEAIDAIDSTSTGKEYDGDARGKVLVCDETGYIICSSGVSTNNPISFYQRVKDYLKAGTTQYEVTGHIAFFNDVVEVKVSEYKYNSELIINKDYEGYVSKTLDSSDDFTNDVINNIKTNDAGYGVGEVVKMRGLSLINEYNHQAGSYLAVDQEGKLIPIFSVLNKDRTQLEIGKCYDIIGLESRYKNRPSFRILKISKSESIFRDFDFRNDAVEATNLKDFYNLGYSDNLSYVKSELTVYKADVYVSQYAEDKYTFNTEYYYDSVNKVYTTGSSQVNAANHYSLGIFNEDLDYKQTLLDFVIDNFTQGEEEYVEASKVTLYFTLAYLDKVDGKNMWRVNIFEDLVYGLDYYYSNSESMTFDTDKANCDREDGKYQTWSNTKNDIVVSNFSNDMGTISRSTSYLKVVNNTSLTISFDKEIVAFTLFIGTYSGISSLGSFSDNIQAYVIKPNYFFVVLKEKTKKIEIDYLGVNSNATNPYLKVNSITVNY